MATKTVAKLGVDVSANTGKLEDGMARATRSVSTASRAWQRSVKDSQSSFDNLVGTVTRARGALAGLAAAGGLTVLVRNSINAADAIGETAARIGISAQELQRYQYAAKLSGLETQTLETGFRFLNRQIAEGKLPYENISQAILDIAERSRNAATPIERTGILVEAFGSRAGAAFTEFTQRGAIGLELLGREAENLGLVFSDELVQGAAEFNDSLDIISASITRNFQSGLLTPFIGESERLKDVFTDPSFADGVEAIGAVIGGLVFVVSQGVQQIGRFAGGLAEVVKLGRELVTSDLPLVEGDNLAELQRRNAAILANGATINPALTGQVGTFKARSEGAKAADAQVKATERIIDGLRKESQQLQLQVDLYGQKEGVQERAKREAQIANDLQREGITLTREQRLEVDALLQNIQRQGDAYQELEDQQKKLEEAERTRQQAIEQLGFTFESAFEDAIVAGAKLSDTLRGLAQDIIRLAFRTAVTQPIASAITGAFSGGSGGLGGIANTLFGSSPASGIGPSSPGLFSGFFAQGGYIPPGGYGVAGEFGKEIVFGGRSGATVQPMEGNSGGNTYYIDATGADRGAVARIEQSLLALAGPGVIERRVVNAQNRGAL